MGQAPHWPCPSRGSRVPLSIKVMAMTTPTTPIDDLDPPLATFAVPLQGLAFPERAVWAIGVRATNPFAEFICEAWYQRSIGDEYSLYANGQLVARGSVTALAPRYFLMVPGTSLLEGFVDIQLVVVRISGQTSRSPIERYLVKKTHPAGIDPMPDVVGHGGLRVEPEFLEIEASITAPADMSVLVYKYANARVNDRLQVWMDGILTERPLTAAEAAGPGPYQVIIPADVFNRISQFGKVSLVGTVIDVAGNTPFGNDIYSAPFWLYSELKSGLYDPPIFLVDGIETTRFNLQTEGNLPLSVVVVPPRAVRVAVPPTPYNQIVLTLTQIGADRTRQTQTLPPVNHTRALGETIPLSSSLFNALGGGFVQMSYQVIRPSTTTAPTQLIGSSGRTTVQVVGAPLLTYPAPSFDGKRGPQTLNVQDYAGGALVTIAYSSMSPSHRIKLKWRYPDGTYVTIASVSGNTSGFASATVSAQIIAQSAGKIITLSYEVETATGIATSETQVLTFQTAVPPLEYELTTFTDNNYNGWEPGPAGIGEGNLMFLRYTGNEVGLFNNTNRSSGFAGVVLKKRFTNMQVGATYRFSARVMRWVNLYEPPVASLRTSQGDASEITTISLQYPNTHRLILDFVARSADIELQYYSNQPSGNGNDYIMTNFLIERVKT